MKGIEMKKNVCILCLFMFFAGCGQSLEKADKGGAVVVCDDSSITLRAPEGVDQLSSWSGTWKSDEKDGHGGLLKCVAWRVEGSHWKARFAGYCNRQFFYEIAMSGREKGDRIVFSGDANLGESDGKYTWRGEIFGKRFEGKYESEKGKTGSFTMQPDKSEESK
jgi:hypothetical protein